VPELAAPGDLQPRILADLLAATANGDKAAYSRFYRLTSPKLYAVALRILKQEALAQDCLQDAYLSVWRQAAAYQKGRAAPMTWLVTIVRNRAIDILRKQRHSSQSDDAELEMLAAPGCSDALIDRLALEKCLEALQPKQRHCLTLAYYEGLTHPELSQRLTTPIGTIKTWIRRGLEQIRQCLAI